jgi:TusA-related sulfurtransferase
MNSDVLRADIKIDMRGLSCPASLYGVKRVVDDLKYEQLLLLISDCPGTQDDLFAWTEQTSNTVLKTEDMPDGGTGYYIKKGSDAKLSANAILDIRGLNCPGPIVEARKLLNGMGLGEVLKLISNCPGIRSDIGGWVDTTGIKAVSIIESSSGEYEFYLQKSWR